MNQLAFALKDPREELLAQGAGRGHLQAESSMHGKGRAYVKKHNFALRKSSNIVLGVHSVLAKHLT